MNVFTNPDKVRRKIKKIRAQKSKQAHAALIVGRYLIGGYFIASALNNFMNTFTLADKIDLPAATLLVLMAAAVKLLLGFFIVLRFHTKYACTALIIYLTVVSFTIYGPGNWTDANGHHWLFFRNIIIIFGLGFVYLHSKGAALWQEEFIPKSQKKIIKEFHHRETPHPIKDQ